MGICEMNMAQQRNGNNALPSARRILQPLGWQKLRCRNRYERTVLRLWSVWKSIKYARLR